MGMRRNIALKYKGGNTIYFYTHWGAETMQADLQNALRRGESRWNDESYLARIIFSELIKGDVLGETGYGIAPYVTDPEFETIKIDLSAKEVNGIPYKTYLTIPPQPM